MAGTGLMLVSGLGLLLMFSPIAPLAIVASPGLLAIFVLGILMLLPVVTAPFGMVLM
jgi:hypothetical protein